MSRKARKAVAAPLTEIASVPPGDVAVLESGAHVEVGFVLGGSVFVRTPDSAPREILALPSTTKVVSVVRRQRVASVAAEVADPLDSRRK